MQNISITVTIFFVASLSTLCISIFLLVEYWRSEDANLRVFSLTFEQLGFAILAGLANLLTFTMKTVAYQNEKSGLITLIGYIGLVYAFLGDIFFLSETMSPIEIVGVLLILTLNVLVVLLRVREDRRETQKKVMPLETEEGEEKETQR